MLDNYVMHTGTFHLKLTERKSSVVGLGYRYRRKQNIWLSCGNLSCVEALLPAPDDNAQLILINTKTLLLL